MKSDIIKLKEIKPVLSGYIRDARAMLNQSAIPDDKVVHDVRVLMKKSRAVLKLTGSQLDNDSVNRDMIALREVGRILCSWRETYVLRKTIKELRKSYPDIFFKLHDYEKLTSLFIKPELNEETSESIREGLRKIDGLLNKAGYRIRFQTMNNLNPQILLKELEQTYNIVIDTYLTCRNNPKQENIHEFRKKSKDFLYQLSFFRPLNNSKVKILEKRIEYIAQNLGRCNDLSNLIQTLGYKYDNTANFPALDELIIKVREEQDYYLSNVWPSAYKTFCPGQNLVNLLGFKLLII